MPPIKRVRKGERLHFPASAFNAFADAAEFTEAMGRSGSGHLTPQFRQAGIIRVKNGSGADCDRFNILGIDSPIFTPTDNEDTFKNQVALTGKTPDEDDHVGRFVVLLTPLPDGRIGPGCLNGVCPVKVDVQDENHRYAEIDDGDAAELKSAPVGSAQILWKESGTGEKWAVVRLGAYSPPFGLAVAVDATNYCYLDESHPDDTHPGEFVVAGGDAEIHALIHSDYVLGGDSVPIRQVVIDVVHVASSWTRGLTAYAAGDPVQETGDYFLKTHVAPVLVDFDPTDISWNDAYVTDGGLLTGNLGTEVTSIHADEDIALTVTPIAHAGPLGEPPEASAIVSIATEFPNLFAVKLSDHGPVWLDEDAIYGFRVRLEPAGESGQSAEWEGDPGVHTFVLPDV